MIHAIFELKLYSSWSVCVDQGRNNERCDVRAAPSKIVANSNRKYKIDPLGK
jgi:hypothetical protein